MMDPDPKFPNRPKHPDFHVVSAIVREADRRAEAGEFDQMVHETINAPSLAYMAEQRALRAVDMLRHVTPLRQLQATWVEAFIIGVRYGMQRRGESN